MSVDLEDLKYNLDRSNEEKVKAVSHLTLPLAVVVGQTCIVLDRALKAGDKIRHIEAMISLQPMTLRLATAYYAAALSSKMREAAL